MSLEDILIVGVDCAVDPRKVGVATAVLGSDTLRLTGVSVCSADHQPTEVVIGALAGKQRTLIALDAPLGWPQTFGTELAQHRAGELLDCKPNDFVRRQTDKFVKARIGQQPLDVGADRIARTALSALSLLSAIRLKVGRAVELAWDPQAFDGVQAIEVYPAATLRSQGLRSSGYKKPEDQDERSGMIEALRARMAIECSERLLIENADALDAVVCALGAADFLRGECLKPEDHSSAEKEGWIWVRDPDLPPRV